jgi:hypothetical protein
MAEATPNFNQRRASCVCDDVGRNERQAYPGCNGARNAWLARSAGRSGDLEMIIRSAE